MTRFNLLLNFFTFKLFTFSCRIINMRFRFSVLFIIAVLLFACQKAQQQAVSADAKHYTLKGTVVAVDKAKKKATIKHEDIVGYMPGMTMEFPVRADWVWDDLTKDAEIRADLVVDNAKGEFWLENIAIVAAPNPNKPAPPVNENFVNIGQEVPDFALTNQDGKRISTKDYRGKALAVTFIYARCPLPDYCIKMSTNFSDLANELHDSDLKDKIRLLSVSFDPKTDTPAKLKDYGIGYLGKRAKADFSVWQLATGSDKEVRSIADFFGLRYEVDASDKTQFAHSLRTAVIAPDGKVTKIFAGNEWTPKDLLRELQKSLENTAE